MVRVERASDAEVAEALTALPGWSRIGDTLEKTFTLPSFPAVVACVVDIAERAEAADHHPDLDVRYRRLRVVLTTHDAGGLTALDLALAAEIEALAVRAGSADPEAGP